ncbi:carbonic anyhydrase [Campylobacter sp. MIT 12-5580]|uniref:DUF2920 family protein n=1 Tax=Campylobacter sp. MIT 12-5580 TaxID=2040651 RepID=UPI0010F8253F|nr:DUF2920 family protein [Campylobacter sp. MIT 12-5580]TKX29844.1 carbonic anyhydrase [Campylobacter sp. MIT 12-5580]
MILTKHYEIQSCDDIELDIKRENKLEFKVYFDDEKQMKDIFIFIAGLGEDNDEEYIKHLSEFLVKEYNVAVLSVDYHCIGSRPQTGAKFYFDTIDRLIIQSACEALKIKVPQELSQDELTQADIKRVFNDLSAQMQMLKDAKELKEDAKLYIHTSLNPRKNEYQNFGLMQAMDICNALLYIKAKIHLLNLQKRQKSLLLGHLMAAIWHFCVRKSLHG